jgi:hypothetical protein
MSDHTSWGACRAVDELTCHGGYLSLDMLPLGFNRIQKGEAFV